MGSFPVDDSDFFFVPHSCHLNSSLFAKNLIHNETVGYKGRASINKEVHVAEIIKYSLKISPAPLLSIIKR